MQSDPLQRIYSEIVVRGRRNSPTYHEVKRDVADLRRIDPLLGIRF